MRQKHVIAWFVGLALVTSGVLVSLVGSPNEERDIKIGALIPLTGKLAGYGEDIRNGMMLAEEELKKEGVHIEVVFEDSAGDPKVALGGARKLIDIDKTAVVVGGPGSSANLAVAPLFEEGKTLFFPISNAGKLNDAGNYIFKIQHDLEFEMKPMAAQLIKKNLKKVGVLFDASSDSNVQGADIFKSAVEKGGGTIVFFESFDSKTVNDFRTVLTRLRAVSPDALYLVTPGSSGGVIVRQTRELNLVLPIFGWSGFDSADFFAGAGASAEGVVITDQPFSCIEATSAYCTLYESQHKGRTPEQYGAHAYDHMQLLSRAFRELRIKGPDIDDSEKVKLLAYFTSHTFEGVSGRLSFDGNGNIRETDFVFRVAKDGKFVEVK